MIRTEHLYQPFEVLYLELDEFIKPTHKHTFFELINIVDGTGSHCINKNKFEYRAGHTFLITPNDSHAWELKTSTKFFVVRFNDIYLKSRGEHESISNFREWTNKLEFIFHNMDHKAHCILKNPGDKVMMKHLVDAIVQEHINKGMYHNELVQQLVNTIITIVARNIAISIPLKAKETATDTALEIIHYIHNNIYSPENLRAEKIGGQFGISLNYLSEYFKKHTGENLQQYITRYRLKLVETRLLHTGMRMNEIAYELHFTDESHLNRIFKKYNGVSPSEYRKTRVLRP